MKSSRPFILALLSAGTVLALLGCGVTIQTGGEDTQRLTEVSEVRAKEIRTEYAQRLRAASPVQKAAIIKTLVDSVSAAYFQYGERMADDWQRGNQERGAEIPAGDIRTLIERSNESQRPVFGAYEDVLDLGMEEIAREGQLDQRTVQRLDEYRNQFYKNYSAVFYPSGDLQRYRAGILDAQNETERMSRELFDELKRY